MPRVLCVLSLLLLAAVSAARADETITFDHAGYKREAVLHLPPSAAQRLTAAGHYATLVAQ